MFLLEMRSSTDPGCLATTCIIVLSDTVNSVTTDCCTFCTVATTVLCCEVNKHQVRAESDTNFSYVQQV